MNGCRIGQHIIFTLLKTKGCKVKSQNIFLFELVNFDHKNNNTQQSRWLVKVKALNSQTEAPPLNENFYSDFSVNAPSILKYNN
jgi:hypothetical protein